MLKPLTVWITTNCRKVLEMAISDHLTCLLRNLYAGQEATVRSRHGTWTGSKLGKEYIQALYCHPAYLTYMQSQSVKVLVAQLYPTLFDPMVCPWNSPGKNTGMGCHSLFQGIFPTQGQNLGLLQCSQFFTIWATRRKCRAGLQLNMKKLSSWHTAS